MFDLPSKQDRIVHYYYALTIVMAITLCYDLLHLSIYLSIYLFIYLSIYLFIYLSIYLSIDPSIHPSIHLSIYIYIYYIIYITTLTLLKLLVAVKPCRSHTQQSFPNHGFHRAASPIDASDSSHRRCSGGSGYESGLEQKPQLQLIPNWSRPVPRDVQQLQKANRTLWDKWL